MRPASDRFLEAVTKSHRIATSVEVLQAGSVIAPITDAIAGTVTLAGTVATRGRLDLTLVDDGTLGLVPLTSDATLAPYGREVRVKRGIHFPDDTTELIGLGVFRIDQVDVTDDPTSGQLQIKIAAQDRSAIVIDAKFEEPYQIAAGTNYVAAILALLTAGYPTIATNFAQTDAVTPLILAAEGADRWALAQSMAAAIGMTLYFDGDGVCVLRPITGFGSNPVITLAEGVDGVLLKAARAWSRQGVRNRWIVTGENTGEATPARGVATDDDPSSPTYYFGPFGRVPQFEVSSLVTSDAQAAAFAGSQLAKQLGTTQSVNFGAIVNPALEPDDVALITRLRAGINEANILDQLTIPLDALTAMTGTTRARQVT